MEILNISNFLIYINIYQKMKKLFRVIGRIIFIVLLALTAYRHLEKPEASKTEFNKYVGRIYEFAKIANVDGKLPTRVEIENYLLLIIKALGIFEAVIALLILFGDTTGGWLAFLYFGFIFIFSFIPSDLQSWHISTFLERQRFVRIISLIGLSFAFGSAEYKKKAH